MVDYAYVKIWGKLVGVVHWIEDRQLASFQYDDKFLALNCDLSPIKMPIRDGNRVYTFPNLVKPKDHDEDTFKGMPGLLADCLPDKYGNRLIERWLAQNGRPQGSMNPVEKLCFIGNRGMGALEFEPTHLKAGKNSFSIEVSSLIDVARKMLSDREHFVSVLHKNEEQAMRDILKVGTSAGGARPKAVVAYNEKTNEIRSGQARAPKGFEHWLLKLDGVSDAQFGESNGWGRIEYAYYLMACACGIDMMESRLFEENGRAHFMTKRFDRTGNLTKHHIQTLCGIQHFDYNDMYSFSYEQLFQTMRQLRLNYAEAEQMYRRMVFNVIATNFDDHTKNFSFILSKGGRWRLAPAYDVCYANDQTNVWVNQQTLSINGKQSGITRSDLLVIGKQNRIKRAQAIIDEVSETVSRWLEFSQKAGVSQRMIDKIKINHQFV